MKQFITSAEINHFLEPGIQGFTESLKKKRGK
jgi:hypothetical protein